MLLKILKTRGFPSNMGGSTLNGVPHKKFCGSAFNYERWTDAVQEAIDEDVGFVQYLAS